MVFVRKIKDYYVLAHSIRKGERIIQKTKYIGKTLPSKVKLDELKKEFLGELEGKKYKYLSQKDFEDIEEKKRIHDKESKKLTKIERQSNFETFMIRYTYDSSKLAGVDVTLRQTYLILKEGIIPKDFKSLKAVKELENHEKGVVAITQYKGKLDLRFIKKLHRILLSEVNDEIAGMLRSELHRNVKIAGTVYVSPKWSDLDKELKGFFKWYKSENRKLHPVVLAALVHLKLISLQPFVDGNSRLSRLLMNWILWKKDYSLIDIPFQDIEHYYDTLGLYQIEHKEKPFVKYIKKRFMAS